MRALLPVLFITSLVSGCLARGGLVGGHSANYDGDVVSVHAAAIAALNAAGVEIEKQGADKASGLIRARYADEKPLTIHIESLTEKASSMTIQIGALGDKTRSQSLAADIKKHLDAQ